MFRFLFKSFSGGKKVFVNYLFCLGVSFVMIIVVFLRIWVEYVFMCKLLLVMVFCYEIYLYSIYIFEFFKWGLWEWFFFKWYIVWYFVIMFYFVVFKFL